MMRTSALLLFFFFILTEIYAQQESRFTHSMFSYGYVNPGWVGSSDMGNGSFILREQNMGFKSSEGESLAPQSALFNFSMPLKKINSGVGANIYTHENGFERLLKFRASYAYQAKLGDGKVGIGAYLGGANFGFDFSSLKAKDETDPFLTKIKVKDNYNVFDLGLGVNYKVQRAYFGFSCASLTQTKLKTENDQFSYIARHLYLYGGYEYQTSNPLLKFTPSVFIRSTGISANMMSLNFLAEYNSLLFGGVVYNTNNDISGIFGVEFKNGSKFDGIRASIAYDLVTNSMRKYSNGSMEVSVGYSFLVNVEKASKTYKSVRFL